MTDEILLYSVTPQDPSGHRMRITLDISQPASDGQHFYLPAWIPGSYLIRDFARQIETLHASSQGQPVTIKKTGNSTWLAAPTHGKPLRLEYTVYAWDLSVRSAHVDETHAFFNGTSVFLAPEGLTNLPCLVELCPPPHTPDWRVHTSMPRAVNHAKAATEHGFGFYQAPDYDALIDHPIEMGTPQMVSFEAHGTPHEMVFTGVAPNLDLERIAADTKKICEAQIALFEPETLEAPFLDASDRYVFMTMITGNDYGGLEHRASTALMIARRNLPVKGRPVPEGYADFLGLVSHEYFHTWHVKRIKPQAFAPYNLIAENHTRLLWVFEGFTSYYDDAMLPRSGVISQANYLSRLERVITRVHRGAGRHKQSVADSSFDAWTRFYKQDENSPNALVSYYTKGSLVALGLDLTIRQATNNTHSLDDVMRLLWQRYGKGFYQGSHVGQHGVDEEAMPALIHEATGVDVSGFIARYAEGCEDVPLESLLAEQGITLSWEVDEEDTGLDATFKNTGNECIIVTAHENGVAHQAGLSAGDTIVAVGGLRIRSEKGLKQTLQSWQSGETVVFHVFRRDELRSFNVKLREPQARRCRLSQESSP